jgi:hypothetical protein
MRTHLLLAAVLAGCLHGAHTDAVTGAELGRVVIYRNGVAFYEREAIVKNGSLTIHVPRAAVDDFLKSLTVVDPKTNEPLAVSIPRKEQQSGDGSVLTLQLTTPDKTPEKVMITYVTESPAWKPSYRAVVGSNGKVMLQSWAIVDNVSSEDWNNVRVGVGASSAMSFRYDLWSVRHVDRDLLQGDDRFAVAPPDGVSPYQQGGEELGTIDDNEITGAAPGAVADTYGTGFSGSTSVENSYVVDGINTTSVDGLEPSRDTSSIDGHIHGVVTDKRSGDKLGGVTVVATDAAGHEHTALSDDNGAYTVDALPAGTYTVAFYYADATDVQKFVNVSPGNTAQVSPRLDESSGAKGEMLVLKGSPPVIDQSATKTGVTIGNDYTRSVPTGRTFDEVLGAAVGAQQDYGTNGDAKIKSIAQKVATSSKEVVIEVAPSDAGRAATVRDKLVDAGVPAKRIHVVPRNGASGLHLLAVAPGQVADLATPKAKGPESDEPIGETRFIADRPMDVKAGTSAMVAMVHQETPGGVVYLYDPISERGNDRFAFRALELDNPTDDTLEPGPMTVYGDNRFIGEGLTEAVPPRAAVVVPFAADRQIVVQRTGSEQQRIAKLETVERGVLTAEMQRRRTTHFVVSSRLGQPAKVFLRHKLEDGWTLTDAPPKRLEVGGSSMFEVDVPAKGTIDVAIVETAPLERSLALSSDSALDLMKVYLDEPDASPALKAQLEALLATHRSAADLADRIATMREQLGEYKARSGELHAQLVTLKAVRTTGDLMDGLRGKLLETSNKVQKLTIAIVDAEEQLMLARAKFGNQLAELHLTDATASR